MKLGALQVTFVDSEAYFPLVDGRRLYVALFLVPEPGVANAKLLSRPHPSIEVPLFTEDGHVKSSVVVVRQHDFRLNAFLLVHELLHAAVHLLVLPSRLHGWIDRAVRHQVLDMPFVPK